MTSGGTGKKELSAKAIAPSGHIACGVCAASMHQSYSRRSSERGAAASKVMNERLTEKSGSAAPASVPAFNRHDHARRGSLYQLFGQFFGDAEQQLAPPHFGPAIVRPHARMRPKYDQIVQEIGAFADHRFRVTLHRVDNDLDRLFGELFGHFGPPGAHQLGRPRFRGVGPLRRGHGVVETGDRISHAGTISYSQTKFG